MPPRKRNLGQLKPSFSQLERIFCGCQNRTTPHYNKICRLCGLDKGSTILSDEGVIRLDRSGNPIIPKIES